MPPDALATPRPTPPRSKSESSIPPPVEIPSLPVRTIFLPHVEARSPWSVSIELYARKIVDGVLALTNERENAVKWRGGRSSQPGLERDCQKSKQAPAFTRSIIRSANESVRALASPETVVAVRRSSAGLESSIASASASAMLPPMSASRTIGVGSCATETRPKSMYKTSVVPPQF